MNAPFPTLTIDGPSGFTQLIHDDQFRQQLCEAALSRFLPQQRWFTSKGKELDNCVITHAFSINDYTAILLCDVYFADDSQETYQLPLAWNTEPEWLDFFREFNAHHVIAQVGDALLTDAIPRANFRHQLFNEMREQQERKDELTYDCGKLLRASSGEVNSVVPSIDTSNTAIIYKDAFFFKLFRKLDPGLNPDLELVRYLSEHTDFENSPAYGGSMTVGNSSDPNSINLGLMIGKIDNQGDAWALFQDLTEGYYERVKDYLTHNTGSDGPPVFEPTAKHGDLDETTQQLIDRDTFDWARKLGKRTGEMHLALASAGTDLPDLTPEPLTAEYRQEIYRAANKLMQRQFSELSAKLNTLSAGQRTAAEKVLEKKDAVQARLQAIQSKNFASVITRIHADYHLGQVLYTEDDFYIIDFEGEPLLSIPERRRKRPPFKDVAGMIRSFHYAAQGQLLLNDKYSEADRTQLINWGEHWFRHLRHTFLMAYYTATEGAPFVPGQREDREDLLDFFVLEKAIYEVAYELNSRPDWLGIPLSGVLFALSDKAGE